MRHPTLSRIDLLNYALVLGSALWKTLLRLQHLRELVVSISGTTVPIDDTTFWQLCTRLERLVLANSKFNAEVSWKLIPTIGFPRMRDLSLLRFHPMHAVFFKQFMERCPNLESIAWNATNSYTDAITALLHPLLQAGTWSHLERLDFITQRFSSEDLSLLINRVPRITTLKIDLYDEYILSLNIPQLLLPQFAHLRHIDLNPHGSLHSSMAQEFLSSCPLLETLRAPHIRAQDVAEGTPWVCLRLKVLNLVFHFDSRNGELQPLVFNQLSRLVRLEELHMSARPSFRKGLKLRLECGLDKLSTLRSLHTIDFEYTSQTMKHPEIDWILEHWRSLRSMKGTRNSFDPTTEEALTRRLKDHGIDV
ncbi:hypothetical protein BGX31_007276 [Mortierella sp. GBA43]|nr:hypothetical protein BGX31_007276 [Mortierella sp. GBA43]